MLPHPMCLSARASCFLLFFPCNGCTYEYLESVWIEIIVWIAMILLSVVCFISFLPRLHHLSTRAHELPTFCAHSLTFNPPPASSLPPSFLGTYVCSLQICCQKVRDSIVNYRPDKCVAGVRVDRQLDGQIGTGRQTDRQTD